MSSLLKMAVGCTALTFMSLAPVRVHAASENGQKVASSIGPVFYFDFDFGRKAVNLTPHEGEVVGGNSTLRVDDFRDGFKVTRYATWDGEIGGVLSFAYDNVDAGLKDLLYGYVGIFPSGGQKWTAEYFVPRRSDISSARSLKIPYDVEKLDGWHAGDRVIYESAGAIAFRAGIGLGPYVGVGAMMKAGGTWKTMVEKSDDYTVTVQVTDTDVRSLSVYAGNILANVGASKFRNEADAFAYSFDLRSERARLAYEDFIRGNFYAIQKLVETGELPDVKHVTSTTSVETGVSENFFFGIPIFWNYNWGSSRIQNFTVEKNHRDGYAIDADYGVFYKERSTRRFFTHRNNVESFFGAAYHYTDAETPSEDAHYGEYYWAYGADDSTHYRFRMAVKEIIRKTGLRRELWVNVPEINEPKYTGVEFKMVIPQDATDRMMDRSRRFSEGDLVAHGLKLLNRYFKNMEPGFDVNDLCADHGWQPVRCKDEMTWQSRSSLKDMYRALVKMRANVGRNRKAFTSAYAEFGKAMTRNQFTFQTAMKLAGGGLKIDYRIEGERVSRYELQFEISDDRLLLKQSTPGPLKQLGVSSF